MTYIVVLREKRRQVMADIERLRGEANEIAARLSAKEGQLHNIDDLLALEEDTAADTARPRSIGTAKPRPARFLDTAWELLKGAAKPIHYRELARAIADKGVYVPGKDPAANLLAHMSRDPRFGRAAGRGTYGLRDWPEVKTYASGSRRPARSVAGDRRHKAVARA